MFEIIVQQGMLTIGIRDYKNIYHHMNNWAEEVFLPAKVRKPRKNKWRGVAYPPDKGRDAPVISWFGRAMLDRMALVRIRVPCEVCHEVHTFALYNTDYEYKPDVVRTWSPIMVTAAFYATHVGVDRDDGDHQESTVTRMSVVQMEILPTLGQGAMPLCIEQIPQGVRAQDRLHGSMYGVFGAKDNIPVVFMDGRRAISLGGIELVEMVDRYAVPRRPYVE